MTLDHVMSEAASQKGLVLVLVSNKNEPPAMLKQLALTLQGAASVCFFPDPDQQTLTKFQVCLSGVVDWCVGGKGEREENKDGLLSVLYVRVPLLNLILLIFSASYQYLPLSTLCL
jgi:hypothetical protein